MLANPKVLSTTNRSAVMGEKIKSIAFNGQNALGVGSSWKIKQYSKHYSIDLYILTLF
jgi:hypothetical protein